MQQNKYQNVDSLSSIYGFICKDRVLDMTFVKQCNIAVLFYPMTTHRAAEDRTIFCVWTKQRWTRKLQYCYT